jgi:hypothetical protein
MRYSTQVTETYRLASEDDVKIFLEELREDPSFEVTKYSSTKKEVKSKGEVIDEYVRFSVTKAFNSEKEPDSEITITYSKDYPFSVSNGGY